MSSTVIAKNIQIGTSGTATNNFNWYQPASPDGTVRLGVGNYGATTLDVVTVNNSGNVGVGTSSPGAKLDVVTNSSNNARLLFTSDANGQAGIQAVNAANSGTIALGLNVTGGNVGIGTSSPATPLNIYTAAARTDFRLSTGKSSGELAAFQCFGLNSSSASVGYAQIVAAASSSTAGSHSGYLAFETAVSGSLAERARIDSSGYLLINQTSNVTSSYLQIKGAQPAISCESTSTGSVNQVLFRNPNGQVGSIGTSGTSTSYNTSSDYRLKENVQPMQGALAKVQSLKPVTYKWKVDGSDGEGFIAHELQAVCPDAVTGEKDAVDAEGNPVYQGIDTSFLVATLTAAIQEQQALINDLTARIAALEAK